MISNIRQLSLVRIVALTVAAAAAAAFLHGPAVGHAKVSHRTDAKVAGHVLRIKGSQKDDRVTLRLSAGDATVLEVDVDDDGDADFSFNRSLFSQIDVKARGGDDLVRVDETNGAIVEATRIDGGTGDDTILGGSAIETIAGGPGDDFIDGNRANDIAFMGPGKDTFRWDPGDASDVVEGGSGSDTMLFNGANAGETVDVAANGKRVTFFRNPGAITMDLNDLETVVFNAIGGPDTITVGELAATRLLGVQLNLSSDQGGGDGAADRVIVNGTPEDDDIVVDGSASNVAVTGLSTTVDIINPEAANDRLDIVTGAGVDTVDADGLAQGAIQLFVDNVQVN